MSWKSLQSDLAALGYIARDELAMAIHLSVTLERPLLLEGAAGVGKTEVAKKLAQLKDTRLIRLQCYEGLDANTAIYEWNYQKQLLSVQSTNNTLSPDQNRWWCLPLTAAGIYQMLSGADAFIPL